LRVLLSWSLCYLGIVSMNFPNPTPL